MYKSLSPKQSAFCLVYLKSFPIELFQVFPYGSVPLKTYLPDGDIDLTAFGGTTSEEELAEDIVSALGGEEQNKAAEFVVKDVQLIRAEVDVFLHYSHDNSFTP